MAPRERNSTGMLNWTGVSVRPWHLALVGAIGLTCGCGTKAPQAPGDGIAAVVAAEQPVDVIEPSPLRRIAPPRLVQLTEFTREPVEAAGASAGPSLTSPQSPASSGRQESISALADDEVFSIVDAPIDAAPAPMPLGSSSTAAGPAATPLPWGPSTPTPELTAIAQRAEQIARNGYLLAQRGGLYSARAKFIESLRMITEALDAQRGTTAHTKALAAGLRALEEADDFLPRGAQIESSINMALVIDAHRTPVLKDRALDEITPLVAQRMYLTYAQEQLAMAGGDQSVASLAYHGLGKICLTPAHVHGPRVQMAEAKAIVYYQAAVIIEPRNFMSANELGVLLARFGRLDDARKALEQAAVGSNSPTTWRNLAVVNTRLGDLQKAEVCKQRSEMAVAQAKPAGTTSTGSQYPVRWVDPETFAQSNSMVPDTPPATAKPAPTPSSPAPATAAAPAAKSSGWKWPWQ